MESFFEQLKEIMESRCGLRPIEHSDKKRLSANVFTLISALEIHSEILRDPVDVKEGHAYINILGKNKK